MNATFLDVMGTDRLLGGSDPTCLAHLWELCTTFLWGPDYVAGLVDFLHASDSHSILDCAGGTGFPCIELAEHGFDVTYSDGSELMRCYFEEKLRRQGMAIASYRSNWLELTSNIPRLFDTVLCRGNSLVYVDSWGKADVPTSARGNIGKALQQFFAILNPGGSLYVDIIHQREFDRVQYPIVEEFGERPVGGRMVKMTWKLSHDSVAQKRIWTSIVSVDGQRKEWSFASHLLRHDDLVELMRAAGFKDIAKVAISGEHSYSVFVGHKK